MSYAPRNEGDWQVWTFQDQPQGRIYLKLEDAGFMPAVPLQTIRFDKSTGSLRYEYQFLTGVAQTDIP